MLFKTVRHLFNERIYLMLKLFRWCLDMFHDWFDCIKLSYISTDQKIFFFQNGWRDLATVKETRKQVNESVLGMLIRKISILNIIRYVKIYDTKQNKATLFEENTKLQCNKNTGSWFIIKCRLTSIRNPNAEKRRSYDRLISAMGFPILVRRHLYIWSGPRLFICICILLKLFQNHVSFRLSPSVVECTTYKYSCIYKWTYGSLNR